MARIQNKRKISNRQYRKIFHVLWEGRVTEKEYFEWLVKQQSKVAIRGIKKPNNNTTSSASLLKLIQTYLGENKKEISNDDEVWIVIDQDNRAERDPHLNKLLQWHDPTQRHFVAISNPCFEYWLLLHFECANNLSDVKNCRNHLQKYYQKQDDQYKLKKCFPSQFYTLQMVRDAICNAQTRGQCKNEDDPFYTNVYLLTDKIINS